jgi:hypothetical protein
MSQIVGSESDKYKLVTFDDPACDCKMQNSNKSAVPLLQFMLKYNVE